MFPRSSERAFLAVVRRFPVVPSARSSYLLAGNPDLILYGPVVHAVNFVGGLLLDGLLTQAGHSPCDARIGRDVGRMMAGAQRQLDD